MRFLCVQCNEALTFVEAEGPEEGSLRAVFQCPTCGREIAMLTNPQETQIVRSLHVQIGGRTVPPKPLEAIRGSISYGRRPKQQSTADGVTWTPAALERLELVPDFVRPLVKRRMEDAARQQGVREITPEVMTGLRTHAGM